MNQRILAPTLFAALSCVSTPPPTPKPANVALPGDTRTTPSPEPAPTRQNLDEIDELLRQADMSRRIGELDAASSYATEALTKAERAQDALRQAHSHSLIAAIRNTQSNCPDAISHSERSLQLYSDALGPESPDVVAAIHNLATCHAVLGNYELARQKEDEALRIASSRTDVPPELVADISRGIGTIYSDTGEYDLATQHLERALQLHRELLGPHALLVAFDLGNLANVSMRLGQYDKALEEYQEVERIFKLNWEDSDPRWSQFHAIVGKICGHLGLRDRALNHFAKAEALLDPNEVTPRAALVYHCRGEAHLELGDIGDARVYLRRALDLRTRALGPDNQETLETRQMLERAQRLEP